MTGVLRTAHAAVVALLLVGAGPAVAQPGATPVTREMAAGHPALIMKQAETAFAAGRRDEASFLFYFGQLRYRARLILHPDRQAGDEGALFAALMETAGRPINGHAYGDVSGLLAIIERVLAADRALPAPDLAGAEGRKAHDAARRGLRALAGQIRANRENIRRQRIENGLGNRG